MDGMRDRKNPNYFLFASRSIVGEIREVLKRIFLQFVLVYKGSPAQWPSGIPDTVEYALGDHQCLIDIGFTMGEGNAALLGCYRKVEHSIFN